MQIVIYSNDFSVTNALNSFIKHQANKSMRVCINQVERVVVRLKDINGPKGGQDKECCVEIKVAGCTPVIVSKRSLDAYSSIRKALGRASRITLRRLGKRNLFNT